MTSASSCDWYDENSHRRLKESNEIKNGHIAQCEIWHVVGRQYLSLFLLDTRDWDLCQGNTTRLCVLLRRFGATAIEYNTGVLKQNVGSKGFSWINK